jgi:asparagine synthase (glutamine-hydrolysing)
MPGIFGVVSDAPRPDLAADLAEMARRLRHHPWYAEDTHVDAPTGIGVGRVALGFVNTAAQPAFNEERSLLAVMEGEVHDYDEQRRELEAAGHRFQGDSHAELLLHGYEQAGQAFFRGLNATFAAALWDRRSRRLILVNDRFGMKPLYYAPLAGRILFASEIKALLVDAGVPRGSDPRGIAQFFTYGQLLGEDTLLEGVRLLPAAGWLTYEVGCGRPSLERYWRLRPQPAGVRTEAETLDRIDAAFTRAVERRTRGSERLGLSLSGGLDARTILGTIEPGRAVTTVSLGIEGSLDLRSAEAMARLARQPFHRYVLNTAFLSRFEEHLRHMVHLTDGHYLSQCIVMPTLPLYRELGVQVLLRGHAGELMHMTKAYNFSFDQEALALRDAAGLEDWLFRHLRTYMLDGTGDDLFAAPYRDRLDALARESLRSCLSESEGIDPPQQRIAHLFLAQRSRRETAMSLAKLGSVVETRLPYLDNDLIDELMAAPPSLKLGETIQAHILRRHMPAFLDVVNANTGTRVGAGRLSRLCARARLKVFAKLGLPGYQPYERLGRWLREDLRLLVEETLLSRRCLDRGVFNPPAVQRVVDGHLNRGRNHTFLLMAMMIFEFGQREFVDGDGYPGPAQNPAEGLDSAVRLTAVGGGK